MSETSSFDLGAYIRALRGAGMYVAPFHEKRSFFVGNPRGMGKAYSRVCRRFRAAFNADRAASIRSVYEALCTEAAQRPLKSIRKPN
jgi:hypothetical protein